MNSQGVELADVIDRYGPAFLQRFGASLSWQQRRALLDVAACRTAQLGGHLEACDKCDYQRPAYNSCRNRHCPKCQGRARAAWLDARCEDLLPVPYFHVVFTLPQEIGPLALQNPRVVYGLLFGAAADTLLEVAADKRCLGVRIGFLAVLHTWGQTLQHHPHLHCIVPGGGLVADDAGWVPCREGFFLPVRVLARLFRGRFLHRLRTAYHDGHLGLHGRLVSLRDPEAFRCFLDGPARKEWVVYAKRPFGGPEQVLAYLARYTHRVAIANGRILSANDGQVRFHYKDYRDGNRHKTMTLDAVEFLRRFSLHVLPKSFKRIRYFGFLANRVRRASLALCRRFLGRATPVQQAPEPVGRQRAEPVGQQRAQPVCPQCKRGRMVAIWRLPGQVTRLTALQPAPAWNTS